jgi:hypothetical protein
MPYIHDAIPTGIEYPGYSSLRVFLYVLFINIFGLAGWIVAWVNAKKKNYRFVIALPVISTTYQIIVHICNLKSTSFNDLNVKFIVSFTSFAIITIWYLIKKYRNE